MRCSVYIATSLDGYIATADGGVDWLHTAGNLEADMGDEDMGFKAFIDSVDCIVMGRKSMDMIASMKITEEQWPYGNLRIIVLSRTRQEPPENLRDKVEIYAGTIEELMIALEGDGFQHAYIDGGSTITAFLNLGLINDITITYAPLLLGEGIPLFGNLSRPLTLENAQASAFPNDFTQVKYRVNYL